MMTTVAALVIVLGLMVSLARYVRDRSANQLTSELLVRLDDLVHDLRNRSEKLALSSPPNPTTAAARPSGPPAGGTLDPGITNDRGAEDFTGPRDVGSLADVPPIIARGEPLPIESAVRAAARGNNLAWVDVLKGEFARSGLLQLGRDKGGFGDLPIALYDGRVLCDAWGNPIVYMPGQHPAIGMAPVRAGQEGDAEFFFSAGPDGLYLTRDDNLYSYEQGRR